MTATTSTIAGVSTTSEALEAKRLRVYRMFLYATMFNNALLAIHSFGFRGGSMLAEAPAWAAPTLGTFGLLTILSAVFALKWKRWGAIGVGACGVAAVALAFGLQLVVAGSLFAIGTLFWGLIARHQWARLT